MCCGNGCVTRTHRDLMQIRYDVANGIKSGGRGLLMLVNDQAADIVLSRAKCLRQFGAYVTTQYGIERVERHAFAVRKRDGNNLPSMINRGDACCRAADPGLIEFSAGGWLGRAAI